MKGLLRDNSDLLAIAILVLSVLFVQTRAADLSVRQIDWQEDSPGFKVLRLHAPDSSDFCPRR